jgi:hypothetical protein
MTPLISVELHPTPPKTDGDDHFQPVVMGGAGVVISKPSQFLAKSNFTLLKAMVQTAEY